MLAPAHQLMRAPPHAVLHWCARRQQCRNERALHRVSADYGCLREGVRTSRLLTSLTPDWKPTTLSRRPSTMALRCRATPWPVYAYVSWFRVLGMILLAGRQVQWTSPAQAPL